MGSSTETAEHAWEGPIFEVGMPRSGTKLLRGLLNQHPRIRITDFETEFLPFLVRWVKEHGPVESTAAFESLYEKLRHTPYFLYRDLKGDAQGNIRREPFVPSQWAQWCGGRGDAAALFEGFVRYELGIARNSGLLWGDKSPGYITRLDLLAQQFPRSRVIHIVRDVRDYCVSIRKAWHKDMRRAADRWGRDVRVTHAHCAAQPQRCIEVRYEDLVQAPARTLASVCSFLQLPYSPGMTRLPRSVENVGDARGHTEVFSSNVRKYVSRLSRREQRAIESLGWTAMRLYGYEPQLATGQAQLGRVSLAYRRLKDGLLLVRTDAAKLGPLGALRFHNQQRRLSRA